MTEERVPLFVSVCLSLRSDWYLCHSDRHCLLSDPRMAVEDIAKETSLSSKTVGRRLEKMRENHILQFTIVTNPSSMRLTGYIEFVAYTLFRHRGNEKSLF
jgi:DNA-binding Lrp family transcriptional regulator